MLIALMSDIHGNREAFEACLAHARRVKAERFVFLGDYVGYGADPGWVVETVRSHVDEGAVALLGNHDAAVLGSDEAMNADARVPGRLAAYASRGRPPLRPRQRLGARRVGLHPRAGRGRAQPAPDGRARDALRPCPRAGP